MLILWLCQSHRLHARALAGRGTPYYRALRDPQMLRAQLSGLVCRFPLTHGHSHTCVGAHTDVHTRVSLSPAWSARGPPAE